MEGLAGHGESAQIVEVLLIQPEGTIFPEIDQFTIDEIHVLGYAIRRESHHLVLARVDLEAGIIGERGIEQADGVRPVELLDDLDIVALSQADGCRRPLPDAIDGKYRRGLEWGGVEGARRVRLMVLAVEHFPGEPGGDAQLFVGVEFFLDPEWPGLEE